MESLKTILNTAFITFKTCIKVGLTTQGFKQDVILINKIKAVLFFIYDWGVDDVKEYKKQTKRTDNGYNLEPFDIYMNRFDSIDKTILRKAILLLKPNLNSIINGMLSFDSDMKSFGNVNEAYCRLIQFNNQQLLNLGMTEIEITIVSNLGTNLYILFGSNNYKYKTFKQLVTYFYNLL